MQTNQNRTMRAQYIKLGNQNQEMKIDRRIRLGLADYSKSRMVVRPGNIQIENKLKVHQRSMKSQSLRFSPRSQHKTNTSTNKNK